MSGLAHIYQPTREKGYIYSAGLLDHLWSASGINPLREVFYSGCVDGLYLQEEAYTNDICIPIFLQGARSRLHVSYPSLYSQNNPVR